MITTIDNPITQDINAHATGCAHIARDKKKAAASDMFSRNPEVHVHEFATEFEAAEFFFGDIASDHYDYGSEEWEKQVMLEWGICVNVAPCVDKNTN